MIKKIFSILAFLMVFGVLSLGNSFNAVSNEDADTTLLAATCYLSSQEVRGNIKVCYYNCGGATVYQTIDAFSQCPFSIEM